MRDYDEAGGPGFPWAMRAVSAFDAGPYNGVGHFIGSYNGPSDKLRLVKIKNPLGPFNPTNKVDFDLKVPAYSPPIIDAPQPTSGCPSAVTLDVLSGQLLNAVWRNGFLYTVHTVRGSGGGSRNLARWYQIQTSAPPASVTWSQLVQWGDPVWRTHVEQLTVSETCPSCSCRDIEIHSF